MYCFYRCLVTEDFLPGERTDLGEAVLCIVRVHGENLLALWSAKDFNNLYQLVDSGLARENWLSQHQFCDHTADGPNVDVGPVI